MNSTIKHISLAGLLTLLTPFSIDASDAVVERDSARIWFHQSKTEINPEFHDNELHLEEMLQRLKATEDSDSALKFSKILVVGAASPEGSVEINRRLSHQRAEKIFDWFSERVNFPDSIAVFDFKGRDWEGLRDLVEKDREVPDWEEVLITLNEIISSVKRADKDSESNLLRLKNLAGGRPYRYMYRQLFPLLRYSKLYVDYSLLYPERHLPPMGPASLDVLAPAPRGDLRVTTPYFSQSICRPFYMDVRTNLLYDALAIPNIGVEFYLGKNWSIGADWMYGWWDKNRTHRYWRAYGGNIQLRKWLGSAARLKPLTGHHLGVYAGVVTYDFEFGGRGYMGGLPGRTLWDRCNYMAGIEYGYSLPIARRLNIDFTIGIGWLGGKLIEYKPEGEIYVWEKTRNLNWIGPTKAEISLVWLIGCDNYNRKKGASK